MAIKPLQLYVPIIEEGREFLRPSILSKPIDLEKIIEPSIMNYSLPSSILKCNWNDDEKVYGEYRDSLIPLDDVDEIEPIFFSRDFNLTLHGNLPKRSISFLPNKMSSNKILNNKIFNYMKRYSDLAQKWAISDDMFKIDGYSLDFRLLDAYEDPSAHKEEFKMVIECGLKYYKRKNNI